MWDITALRLPINSVFFGPLREHLGTLWEGGLVPAEGFEPPTYGLQNRCTTTVLSRHFKDVRGQYPPPPTTTFLPRLPPRQPPVCLLREHAPPAKWVAPLWAPENHPPPVTIADPQEPLDRP